MSYCRWSTDDFQCDIYAYASGEGVVIHVAARRAHFTEPLPEPIPLTPERTLEWAERHAKVSTMLQHAEGEWIDLPNAGHTFIESSPAEAAARLRELARIGFRVPARVIEDLEQESALQVGPCHEDPGDRLTVLDRRRG